MAANARRNVVSARDTNGFKTDDVDTRSIAGDENDDDVQVRYKNSPERWTTRSKRRSGYCRARVVLRSRSCVRSLNTVTINYPTTCQS